MRAAPRGRPSMAGGDAPAIRALGSAAISLPASDSTWTVRTSTILAHARAEGATVLTVCTTATTRHTATAVEWRPAGLSVVSSRVLTPAS